MGAGVMISAGKVLLGALISFLEGAVTIVEDGTEDEGDDGEDRRDCWLEAEVEKT
jgi:hypothetical protein